MSETSIFAPVSIDRMWLTHINFDLGQRPADDMVVKVDVNFNKTSVDRDDEGRLSEAISFTVNARLVNAEDDDDVRLSASASMVTEVSTAFPGLSDEDGELYLTRNAISMSYSHARSCIMSVSAMSPMGGFVLPPVLPDEILSESEGDEME